MTKPEKLTGTVPRPKRRAGVMPTKRETVEPKKIDRQKKHKGKDSLGDSP